ncbi:hypothetical protein CFter6_3570 [Collimonas fungivorans]|uniref:Preprotein translocase subunit SecD n=1 Tax=Collimonas fungivorans TaxID=158899 RepID=A0A127PER7_9BURK|nr:hypothetical protein [Collimonas fungivorans]AMO96203.1 hypothetical protein CFter6_3570 [Collimonas fungivorans]
MRAEDILPNHVDSGDFNGTVVRKGTVGAFLVNARTFLDPSATTASRRQAEQHMAEAVATLDALGLFEVFALRDPVLQAFVERHR